MQRRFVQVVGVALGGVWLVGSGTAAHSTRWATPADLPSVTVLAWTGGGTLTAGLERAAPGRSVEADDLAAQAVANVQAPSRKPRVESVRRAFARALDRGWRYLGSARHVAVQVPRPERGVRDSHGHAARQSRPLAGSGGLRTVALQDYYGDGRAEVTVWDWDDGDPATVEGTVYLYSHDTGEEFYFDVQYFAASDTDGWVTWGALIDYRGGWVYRDEDPQRTRYGWRIGTEFGPQVEVRPAALQLGGPNASMSAYSRERCLRMCLNRKMNGVFNATRAAALTSLIACTRAPATRLGLVVYASCVGGGSLGGFAIALTNEFVFATSCGDAC